MTKRQMIDRILDLNTTAEPSFLAPFDENDLQDYLHHLEEAQKPRLSGDPHRYDHYFQFDGGDGSAQARWRKEESSTTAIAVAPASSQESEERGETSEPVEQDATQANENAAEAQTVLAGNHNADDSTFESNDEKETWLF